MLEWAARNKVKWLLLKCDVIPEVPSNVFTQCFKELVNRQTSQSLCHCNARHHPCSKKQVLKGSRFEQQKRMESEKKFQVRTAVHARLFWYFSPGNTLLPASICRKRLSLPFSQAKKDNLSQCLWKSHNPFPSGLISNATLVWYIQDEVWHFLL